ncbi:MAG: KilA-N domain-containing protein [Burkholderiaceae bacterium]|nr:KilA-N domain-containing protein [Burkholderiaceae bacterium]
MTGIITCTYQGHAVAYQDNGWFNATQAAAKFGKEPRDWLRLHETCDYIAAFARHHTMEFNPVFADRKASEKVQGGNSGFRPELKSAPGLIAVKRGAPSSGGGTWLHPKLAVAFARWLDVDFAVWCDAQIDNIIRGKDDWHSKRHAAASSSKVMSAFLDEFRATIGKETASYHHMNEHKLVNSLMTGEYKGLDREALTTHQLDFLAHFEVRNAIFIGMGMTYEQRKGALKVEAMRHMGVQA